MARNLLDRFLERSLLGLLLSILVFGPLATGAVRAQDLIVIQGLTLLASAIFITRLFLLKTQRFWWPPVGWVVLAFTALAMLRMLQADLPFVAKQELMRVLIYAPFFVILMNTMQNHKHATLVIYVAAGVATLASAYAIFQFTTGSDRIWLFRQPASYAGRGSGTYICPNNLAGLLAMVLPATTSLVVGGRSSPLVRLVLGYAALVMMAGLGVSFSRAGWVAAATGLAVLAWIHLRSRQHIRRILTMAAAVGLVVVVAAITSPTLRERAGNLLEGPIVGSSLQVRTSLWKSSWRMWRDHPWLGVGPGHFDYRYPFYREPVVQKRPAYSHNDYLNTLADWGVVGFGLALCFVGLTLQAAFKPLKEFRSPQSSLRQGQSRRWSLAAGMAAGLCSILVHSVADFNMQIPANALLALALAAGLNSPALQGTARGHPGSSRSVLALAAILLFSAILWSAKMGLQRTRHDLLVDQALHGDSDLASRESALRKALAIEPQSFECRFQLGQVLRLTSMQGNPGNEEYARQAIKEYVEAAKLNPFAPLNSAYQGICHDWLEEHNVSTALYERALELDPNNHYLYVLRAWHDIQTGHYRKARTWLLHSLHIHWWPNTIAWKNLERVTHLIDKQPKETRDDGSSPAQ